MTNQEIYNKVRDHLLTQMQKSEEKYDSEYAPLNACRYRGHNGLKCAIGVLIPDNKYHSVLEGLNAKDRLILVATGCQDVQGDLLVDLQVVHDEYDPTAWAHKLGEVAEKYKLER